MGRRGERREGELGRRGERCEKRRGRERGGEWKEREEGREGGGGVSERTAGCFIVLLSSSTAIEEIHFLNFLNSSKTEGKSYNAFYILIL